MLRIRAGSVHPVTAPPIPDGAVLVADDGRIAAVGAHAQVPDPPGARRVEFPDAVLVPGLVNTHTHLELTHLAGRNPEREFSRWIRTIRALKDATTPEEFDHPPAQGVRDCCSPRRSRPGAFRCKRFIARQCSIPWNLASWNGQRGGSSSTVSKWTNGTSQFSGTRVARWPPVPAPTGRTGTARRRSRRSAPPGSRSGLAPTR